MPSRWRVPDARFKRKDQIGCPWMERRWGGGDALEGGFKDPGNVILAAQTEG